MVVCRFAPAMLPCDCPLMARHAWPTVHFRSLLLVRENWRPLPVVPLRVAFQVMSRAFPLAVTTAVACQLVTVARLISKFVAEKLSVSWLLATWYFTVTVPFRWTRPSGPVQLLKT